MFESDNEMRSVVMTDQQADNWQLGTSSKERSGKRERVEEGSERLPPFVNSRKNPISSRDLWLTATEGRISTVP